MSKKSVKYALAALTLVGLGVACWKYLDPAALSKAWTRMDWGAWGWLLVLPFVYLTLKSLRFYYLQSPLTRVSGFNIWHGYGASQAASLLPGGVAMRAATMNQLGISPERSAGPILLNSLSDQLCLLIMGLAACFFYPDLRTPALVVLAVFLGLGLLLWWERSRNYLAGLVRSLFLKFGGADRFDKFLESFEVTHRKASWTGIALTTLGANAVSVLILYIVVVSMDFEAELGALVAAFVVPQLLGRLSPLPAGAGVIEAGMVGFLQANSPMSVEQATVATLLFRTFDTIGPALYGALFHLAFSSRKETEASSPA